MKRIMLPFLLWIGTVQAEEFNTDDTPIENINNLTVTFTKDAIIPVGSSYTVISSSEGKCTLDSTMSTFGCMVHLKVMSKSEARRVRKDYSLPVKDFKEERGSLFLSFEHNIIEQIQCGFQGTPDPTLDRITVKEFRDCAEEMGFLLAPPKVEIKDIE